MATKTITEKTGKRMAAALEGVGRVDSSEAVKIPHIDSFDFETMALFAQNHGHYSNTELAVVPFAATSVTGSPLMNFLKGLATLSNYEAEDEGRVAFCSYTFMNLLFFEASRCNDFSLVKATNGLITKIGNCTVKGISNEFLPSTFSFLILGNTLVNGLNELEANGLLDDAEALNTLLVTNEDLLYYHAGNPELNVLPVKILPGDTGKTVIKIGRPKEVSTNKWFYKTAESIDELPTAVYGTSIDVVSSSSPWYQSTELTQQETEITPTSGHTAIIIVEVMRTLKPIAARTKTIIVGM